MDTLHTMKKYYITATRRGLGKALADIYHTVDNLEDCDVFINCKHDGFSQVDMLYKASALGKRVVSIGSYASDWIYHPLKSDFKYAVEKKALRDANSQLFDNDMAVTCVNFGYFDSERSAEIVADKMSIEYCIGIIKWIIEQEHRVKELTVCA
tara:strand:+ start:159 stop:617 length:459 start_codon:yes stop_codon:yes gene_type:complete